MFNKLGFQLMIIPVILLLIGCSGHSSSMNPVGINNSIPRIADLPVGVSDFSPDGIPLAGMGALGLFSLHVDPVSQTASLESLRQGALTDVLEVVDITNFLTMAPCTKCVKIKSVALDADGNVVVSVGIKHPFPAGDPFKPITGRNRADLHVFNIEGTVISNIAATTFASTGEKTAGFRLLNADGYSGYLDESIDEIYLTEATIHPYITHFDDYSVGNFDPGNPMGFVNVTDPPPTGNLVMAMGCDYNYQDYVFSLDGPIDFIYAVGCTYALSAAAKSQRFTPEYRIPQHNKKAASEVSLVVINNDLGGGDVASTAQAEVHVVDLSHGVGVGAGLNEMYADSSVGSITIEVPGVMSAPITIPGGSSTSGTGHSPADPLVYQTTITNTAGGAEGNYGGLIKVVDTYAPGQNGAPSLSGMDGIKRVDPLQTPTSGLFAITEFATYQYFEIGVGTGEQLTIITPNGGELWMIGSSREITWNPASVTGTMLIEYSKDNFVADIHTIATGEDNDGSFMWDDIPNDPSHTVRVRISSTGNPSINDVSDADFSIIGYIIVFSDEGVLPEQRPGFNDISPALCIETDGEIKMAFSANQPIDYAGTAYSYGVKSNNGLNWFNFYSPISSGGGMWACHGDATKILANTTGNSWMTIILYSQTTFQWATPFTPSTENPYDGGIITTYITRQPEIIQAADGYVYLLGDRNNMLQFKKSEAPNSLSAGPSGGIWQTFPVYNIGPGYFSRARSSERAPNDTMYFVYYVNDTANLIKLAYNTDSTGLVWDTSTVAYDGSSTSTTGAHDPGLDIDPSGEFHVTFVRVSGANNQLCYINSDDGTTWSQPSVISEIPDTINDNPICFFVFDTIDFLASVWRGGTHIYVSFSGDGGQNWADAVQVDSLLPENIQPDFVVTSDGIMHIAWSAKNNTHYDIHFRNAWLEIQ